MKYTMLLWPHANARYQQETRRLALSELRLMLEKVAPEAQANIGEVSAMPCLSIEVPAALSDRALSAIARHSLLYGLFEAWEDRSLMPVEGRAPACLGEDLPAILKYKGKTNEMFLQLLWNAALWASDFWEDEGLTVLDPMCGRATAPFIALNRGWNAVGADVDRTDLREAEKFFKRYLEYHRFKHTSARSSRTLRGGRSVPVVRFDVPDASGRAVSLDLAELDAARAGEAFPKHSFHLVACDLPYGVKHDAQVKPGAKGEKNWLEALLRQSLSGIERLLKPGGAVAMSFNAQTFRLDRLRALMAEAGLEPMAGGPYDGFEHWVEQAITRDVAVARKPR